MNTAQNLAKVTPAQQAILAKMKEGRDLVYSELNRYWYLTGQNGGHVRGPSAEKLVKLGLVVVAETIGRRRRHVLAESKQEGKK